MKKRAMISSTLQYIGKHTSSYLQGRQTSLVQPLQVLLLHRSP